MSKMPPMLAVFVGAILIAVSSKFLSYAMDRGGKLFYVAFFAGFPVFFLGGFLVFCCFLPDPPPIFWFVVRPFHFG